MRERTAAVLLIVLLPLSGGFITHTQHSCTTTVRNILRIPSSKDPFISCRPLNPLLNQQHHQQKQKQQQNNKFKKRHALVHLEASSESNDDDVDEDNSKVPETSVRRSRKRALRRWAVSLALGISMFRGTPADAKFSYELRDTPTSSLRPGITKSEAELIEQGELDGRSVQARTALPTEPGRTTLEKKTSLSSKQSSYYDAEFNEDDDVDDFLEEEVIRSTSKNDQKAAKRVQSRSNFAAYHEGKSSALTMKVAAAFFVPTYGAMIVREYLRRRREEAYVKKGLEILEAQKAEYFNITETSADADVQDALKNLKKNETKTDDDDDDDDDEDGDDEDDNDEDDNEDEDEKPRGRRGGPRRPSGNGGGGDSGGSDGGASDGRGKPSGEDLDRLNEMFRKS